MYAATAIGVVACPITVVISIVSGTAGIAVGILRAVL